MELIANQHKNKTLLHGAGCSSAPWKQSLRTLIERDTLYTQAVCKLN